MSRATWRRSGPSVAPTGTPDRSRRAEAVLRALEQFARFTPEEVGALARAEAVFRGLDQTDVRATGPPVVVRPPRREYRLSKLLAVGDLSDVHLAAADGRKRRPSRMTGRESRRR